MGWLVLLIAVWAFVYAFKASWRFTSHEASMARRTHRAAVRQQIEEQARSRRQGGV